MGMLDELLKGALTSPQQGPDGKVIHRLDASKMKAATRDLVKIRRNIEAERLPKEKLNPTEEEQKQYPRIKQQKHLDAFKGAVQAGELLIVGILDNSEIVVKKDGKLKIVSSASNLKIFKEQGAVIEIAEMDATVTIEEKELVQENCQGCGAPHTVGQKCEYCGRS